MNAITRRTFLAGGLGLAGSLAVGSLWTARNRGLWFIVHDLRADFAGVRPEHILGLGRVRAIANPTIPARGLHYGYGLADDIAGGSELLTRPNHMDYARVGAPSRTAYKDWGRMLHCVERYRGGALRVFAHLKGAAPPYYAPWEFWQTVPRDEEGAWLEGYRASVRYLDAIVGHARKRVGPEARIRLLSLGGSRLGEDGRWGPRDLPGVAVG